MADDLCEKHGSRQQGCRCMLGRRHGLGTEWTRLRLGADRHTRRPWLTPCRRHHAMVGAGAAAACRQTFFYIVQCRHRRKGRQRQQQQLQQNKKAAHASL